MLKKAVVCILLAAAAAMAWYRYQEDDVPVPVEWGTKLTWGDGLLWGIFPIYGSGMTYVLSCDPSAASDSMWDTLATPVLGGRLEHTGLTFQWKEQPVLWAVGYHEGDDTSKLFWYDLDSSWSNWRQDTLPFELDYGATIAYDPNRLYHATNFVVPGWVYCLPGGSQAFWRYAVPGGTYVEDLDPYGYYPFPGAIIADQTPPFRWGSVATPTYRLLVSTQSDFSDTVIDEQVGSPEHEPTTELANGTYYWRTAAWVSSAWSWSGDRNFDLQGGWQSLADIPEEANDGTIIAYDSGSFSDYSKSILALPDASVHDYFYRYDIGKDTWIQLDSAPDGHHTGRGTSLTTRTPAGAESPRIMAVFGSEVEDDNPYDYDPDQDPGECWQEYDCDDTSDSLRYYSHLPRTIWDNSSMVLGGSTLYLIPAKDNDRNLYELILIGGGGGGQASVSRFGGVKAHAIAGYHGVEVEYQLPASVNVRATLHDAVGRQVSYLDVGEQQRGTHRLRWDRDSEGRRLSAGTYFVLLDMGVEKATLKAVIR
jgi:hypothetical protein